MNTFSVASRVGAGSSILGQSARRAFSQGVRQSFYFNRASIPKTRSAWTTFSKIKLAQPERSALPTLFYGPTYYTSGISLGSARFNSTSTNVPVVDGTTNLSNASELVSEAVDTNAIIEAVMKVGDLKAMGLVNYTPVGFIQGAMEFIHVSTGIPWWGTIVATTLLIRLALFPVVLKLQKNAATLHNIKPEMDRLSAQLNQARASGDKAATARYFHDSKELFEKHRANPFKMMALPLMQAPVMLTFFIALRDMAQLPVPQFQTGGTAWFTDLTAADPYYVLPVLSGLGFLTILELGSGTGTNVSQSKNARWLFRFMTIAMIPATAGFSSSIFVYWVTSNFVSIGQVLALKSPVIRKSLGIPLLVEHKIKGVGFGVPKKPKSNRK